MEFEGTCLRLPDTTGGTSSVDLADLLEGERRQAEIAFVTPMKAPELLRAFSSAWRSGHDAMLSVNSMLLKAQQQLAHRRATIVLDVAPEDLKKRGLSSNDENRSAVIELDVEHQRCKEIVDELAAALEHVKGKLRTLERDHSSVKAIVNDGAYHGSIRMASNPNLSGGVRGADVERAPEYRPATSASTTKPGFGKAVY